jgi:cell division inhibitor SepF
MGGYPRQRTGGGSRTVAEHVAERERRRSEPARLPSPHGERPTPEAITDEPAPGEWTPATTPPSSAGAARSALVRGALAIEPVVSGPPPVPAARTRSKDAAAGPPPLSRITTVHPRSYNEARTIGERYREGIPVILNLTELDDAAAKRLVDFAAGLAFALRGSIDKITNRVFLLSPSGVDVSAEDRRRLAERGFFGHG